MTRPAHPKAKYPIKKDSVLKGEAREAVRKDLVTRYRDGATIRDLAELTGRSYGFVHRLLAEAGVLRARGGANGRGSTPRAAAGQ